MKVFAILKPIPHARTFFLLVPDEFLDLFANFKAARKLQAGGTGEVLLVVPRRPQLVNAAGEEDRTGDEPGAS